VALSHLTPPIDNRRITAVVSWCGCPPPGCTKHLHTRDLTDASNPGNFAYLRSQSRQSRQNLAALAQRCLRTAGEVPAPEEVQPSSQLESASTPPPFDDTTMVWPRHHRADDCDGRAGATTIRQRDRAGRLRDPLAVAPVTVVHGAVGWARPIAAAHRDPRVPVTFDAAGDRAAAISRAESCVLPDGLPQALATGSGAGHR
jgi:hypothetical protein